MAYDVHTLKMESGYFKNFTYLVVDRASREAAVIDPAWEPAKILSKLESLRANLSSIWLTHSHFDHVNLAASLAEKFRAEVRMHSREIGYYGFACPNLKPFEDLDRLRIGETLADCLHTPGHTAGGSCFLLPGHIFTGDTLFTEGCGICHAAGGCPHDMFRSLQRIKKRVALEVQVHPGHSFGKEPGQSLAHLMRHNIYLQLDQETDFVAFRMRNAGQSLQAHLNFR
jgi:glyoxylase-like metal-dependent hydrolase (beta-lactamase superfamily II)